MIQPPILVGLKVCHEAIVEEKTKRVTLVNCFRRLEVASFPSPKTTFKICAVLTDGMGQTDISISIKTCSELDEIFFRSWRVNLTDPLPERWFLVNAGCSFPEAGRYQVGLEIANELLGQCVFTVFEKGS